VIRDKNIGVDQAPRPKETRDMHKTSHGGRRSALKLLAVTTAKRMALAPQLPTMAEAGVPGFEMASWQAVYGPKNLPKPILQRLSTEITSILQMPEVKDKLTNKLGMEVVAGSPAQLAALMQKEIPRWAELVRKSGAKAD
jgi:tripartite-type tricarboxylate transporter receptor subunit TctC